MAEAMVKATAVSDLKKMLDADQVKKRFADVLGAKAPQFMASITNVVAGSTQLKACDAASIMGAAFVAASYDLPIDSNLGFAAIVPYKANYKDENGKWQHTTKAQFQMMYKGFIQLAIRSGQYSGMNCSEVYEDELVSYNPITGTCEFARDFSQTHQRANGETDKIVGYYACYQLTSGFRKEIYMSKAEVTNHAKKYSQSFRSDIDKNTSGSKWTTDFDSMAKKTVIKMLLSKWGILSIDMQRAIIDDQKVYESENQADYIDNKPDTEEVIDAVATPAPADMAEDFAAFDAQFNG